jgi:hypothetical protein
LRRIHDDGLKKFQKISISGPASMDRNTVA